MFFFVLLDLENGRIPSEGQQIVNQLEEKLNSINKFATEAYNNIISNAQVILILPGPFFFPTFLGRWKGPLLAG